MGGPRGEILLHESRDDMAASARSAGPAHCHGDQLVRAKDPGVDPVVLIGLRFCCALSFSFPWTMTRPMSILAQRTRVRKHMVLLRLIDIGWWAARLAASSRVSVEPH